MVYGGVVEACKLTLLSLRIYLVSEKLLTQPEAENEFSVLLRVSKQHYNQVPIWDADPSLVRFQQRPSLHQFFSSAFVFRPDAQVHKKKRQEQANVSTSVCFFFLVQQVRAH